MTMSRSAFCSLFEPSTLFSPQSESDLSLQEPFTGKHKSADTVEKLVDSLVPSLLGGESFVPAFLYTYLKFTVIQNLLFLQ